jgi:uroporphyrinogen decarboxylase
LEIILNSRERILAAVNHQPVDRIPTDIWATPEIWEKLRALYGNDDSIMTELHIDGLAGVDAKYIGPPLPEMPKGEKIDMWGMRSRSISHPGGTYDEQYFYPLAYAETIDDLDLYQWPRVEWFDYSNMKEEAKSLREKRAVICGYLAPFFYHNLLRGLEQSLVDPLINPELTHEIIRRISDFFYEHHRRMFEACDGLIDLGQVTDDLGSQNGPLISMDLYKEFYAPQHKRFIDLCHSFGLKVYHHDDGSCREFLPMLVDMGIDLLNPVQWTCPGMDMLELKREFGSAICFHGAVENQKILPFGSPEEVRREVRHCIDSLASDNTGYILAPCHNIQGNTPLENVIAMYDEAWKYGQR